MGASYVPEIFVPSEKQILSPAFHDDYFVPPSGLSPAAAPMRKTLCANCVMFLFGAEFGLCALLRCAGCFWGRFTALKSSLHWPNVKQIKAVEAILNRWTRKALDDEMSGDLFLAALANSIEALRLKWGVSPH